MPASINWYYNFLLSPYSLDISTANASRRSNCPTCCLPCREISTCFVESWFSSKNSIVLLSKRSSTGMVRGQKICSEVIGGLPSDSSPGTERLPSLPKRPPLRLSAKPENRAISHLPFDELEFKLGDRLGGVESLRAGLGAVHDGVAAIEPERVFEIVEPFAGGFVAAVRDPAGRLQQRGGAEEAIAVPPIARARGRAAGAQDALVEPVELFAVLVVLLPFLLRRRRGGLQPRLDRGILRVEIGEVRHEVLDHRLMRQRIDLHRAILHVVHRPGAGQRVLAVDVHGAGAADALAAGAAEGQRRIDIVLDPDQAVQDHRAAIVGVDVIGVDAWILAVVRIPAV